jgi:hypothetical protein
MPCRSISAALPSCSRFSSSARDRRRSFSNSECLSGTCAASSGISSSSSPPPPMDTRADTMSGAAAGPRKEPPVPGHGAAKNDQAINVQGALAVTS